jgi:hypothetical protein
MKIIINDYTKQKELEFYIPDETRFDNIALKFQDSEPIHYDKKDIIKVCKIILELYKGNGE